MWLVAAFAVTAQATPGERVIAPEGARTVKADPPKFPPDPTLPALRCLVRVDVDTDGVPTDVQTRQCGTKFAELATEAVEGWRWAPVVEGGVRVPATLLVPITFTPKGKAPIAAPEKCTYALAVRTDGRVELAAPPGPTCEIWPLDRVSLPVHAAEDCRVDVDAHLVRDTDGWLVPDGCADERLAIAASVVSGSLFVTGTASTRFIVDLPDPLDVPTAVGMKIDGPSVDMSGPERIAGDGGDEGQLDPKLAVPDATKAPTVDLGDLRNLMKQRPPPPPPPADDEGDEEDGPPPDEDPPDDGT